MNNTTWNTLLGYLQFAGFAIIAAALPFSNFLMSLGMFCLGGAVVLQIATDLTRKVPLSKRWKNFTENTSAVGVALLFVLPIVGLLWTSNYDYALWDVRMKLPLLVLPLFISMANPLTQGQFRALVGVYVVAVLIALLWCLQVYWMGSAEIDRDVRNSSVFISHVRFALLIALALGLVVRFAHQSTQGRVLILLYALPCLYFIYVIGSVTGVVALTALAVWGVTILIRQQPSSKRRLVYGASFVLVIALVTAFFTSSYTRYFSVKDVDLNNLDARSRSGESYEHNLQFPLVENGQYVLIYIARNELYSAWQERSIIHPDSVDGRGHALYGTLIRYMASKGLRKDADGVVALTNDDVRAIELGIPNCNEPHQGGLQKRLNRIFFEWSNYRAGGNPDGHSVMQRLEFWKMAVWIIRNNALIGVGTGDVKDAYREAYQANNSRLDEVYRLRAHNQYLTMWVTYGIVGFLLFVTIVVWPILSAKRSSSLNTMIVMLAALSFLTEDTLESQAGVMFMGYFYSLFTAKRLVSLEELRRTKSKGKPLFPDDQGHK